jgi:hypothetical protein
LLILAVATLLTEAKLSRPTVEINDFQGLRLSTSTVLPQNPGRCAPTSFRFHLAGGSGDCSSRSAGSHLGNVVGEADVLYAGRRRSIEQNLVIGTKKTLSSNLAAPSGLNSEPFRRHLGLRMRRARENFV